MFVRRSAPLGVVIFLFSMACSAPQGTTTTTSPDVQEEPQATTLVRFVHAVPDAPAVNVSVGGVAAGSSRAYRSWGDWTEVPAGEQEVTMRQGESTIFDDIFTFEEDKRYLIVGYGMLTPMGDELGVGFMVHQDEWVDHNEEQSFARFVNAIPDGDRLGLCITTGDTWNLLWPGQQVGTVSEYKIGPLYDNSFELVPGNTSLPPVHEFEYNLQHGILYTFIVTGASSNDTLEVFAVTDHPSLRPQ